MNRLVISLKRKKETSYCMFTIKENGVVMVGMQRHFMRAKNDDMEIAEDHSNKFFSKSRFLRRLIIIKFR